ncbi:RILP-like protein 2 [Hemicordylus capensis]|uniref:RILP-like protein 2 n=1 Tax=Hemicordylus capensis TaxID=884348 RepID=UPI002302B15C|nr:RILP-like protein 2 [Hemicordylus capensis]
MQAEQPQQEEGEEGEEEATGGPDRAFGKSPFQLTAEDVYDISYILGRELHKISGGPRLEVPARVARLQFKVVSVLEMLEALVNENNLAVEALKMERDSLRREVEALRRQPGDGRGGAEEVNLGPNKMVIDLTDANRPRFTLQELREVLQERNQLKAQLLVAQEELQCYKSGFISQKQDQTEPAQKEPSGPSTEREERAIIRKLFAFKRPR